LSPAARGAVWMTLAAASFAVLLIAIRVLSAKFHTVEIVLFRAVFGLLLIVPVVMRSGLGCLATRRFPMHCVRTAFAFAAMLTFYFGLATVRVADAMALTFVIPIFTTIAAAVILGERVNAPRWAAVAAGFAGALIIIRPGLVEITPPMMMVVVSSVFYAGAWTSVKFLTRTEPASAIVFYMNAMMVPVTLVPSLFVWVGPAWSDAPALVVLGACGWAAHFCQARAFGEADASVVVPFDFLRLPFGAALAWVWLGEPTGPWTWLGAVVIFAATYFITRRESRAARRRR
jgi:drug/metabolite transporter (DMT)-like permease